jgi:hypothetical protein
MCNAYNHPPGCTCGWGGEGHSGVSYGGLREWIAGDFTRPTTCPECGAEVFFIRHNGGSVWVEELGWPWPKHPCMDRQEPAHTFSVWTAKAEGLLNPKLGVITRLESATATRETVYEIELADGSTITISLRYDPPESSMIGALVVVSEESNVLLHRTYAEIPFAFTLGVTNTTGFPLAGTTPEQERIFEAICLVAKKAWEAGALVNGVNEQFAAAKQEALRLIQTLSPPLRRSVDNYYTSRNWEPLKRRRRYYLPDQRDGQPKGAGVSKKVRPTEDEIRTATDEVAKQAWSAIGDIPEAAKFKLAKVEARRLIKQLPSGLSGQVEHRMAHQGWDALRQRRPANPPVVATTSPPAPQHTAPPSRVLLTITEDRIAAAIQSVAERAWVEVSQIEGTSERLKQAKQVALRLIRMLSRSIRGTVEHRFTSGDWKLLCDRNPTK